MKKVKITVLKTTLDKELADEYGIDGLSDDESPAVSGNPTWTWHL